MVFTTLSFIVFFAVVFFGYYVLPSRCRWWLLLGASWFFYAYMTPYYLMFLGFTTCVTYFSAVGIGNNLKRQKIWISANGKLIDREAKKAYKAAMERKRKYIVAATVVSLIGLLVAFKYLDFLFANVNWLGGVLGFDFSLSPLHMMLPIGLSFYVFQSLGYCIDVSREMVEAERNFFRHALFVSYFPQVLQGPIGDYGRLAKQLFEHHSFDYNQTIFGLQRVVWGFFKKLCVANVIASRIDPVWGQALDHSGLLFWLLIVVLYAFQLYADFSGYMDIACGCSQMLGIRLEENFMSPYLSKDIAEFWRRWHITLGEWFKNYLFYPFLRNELLAGFRKKLSGVTANRVPTVCALLVVWLLIGLWHGADWAYVIYGLYHGMFIILAVVFSGWYCRMRGCMERIVGGKVYSLFQVLRTFLIVAAGYAIFKPADLSVTASIVKQSIRGLGCAEVSHFVVVRYMQFLFIACGVASLILVDVVHLKFDKGYLRLQLRRLPKVFRWAIYLLGVWVIVWMGMYGAGMNQFEYFKF